MFEFEWELLKTWFLKKRRILPWRVNSSPYAIWISEIMLQQTQVAVVISYFERWMDRFPTIQKLGEASLQDVLKAWEGLGYYSRARNLHEAARYILTKHHGQIPSNRHELEKIKGLGPYTIGAILSFAFHQRTPAVDANVIRVLARYFMLEEDISKARTQKKIRELVQQILPDNEHWIANEGLIELGAMVCGRKPKCEECPVRKTCKGYIFDAAHKFPKKAAKKEITLLYRGVAVIHSNNHFLVIKGKAGNVMADLYEFPYFEILNDAIGAEYISRVIQETIGLEVNFINELEKVSHSFTRYRAHLRPFLFSSSQKNIKDYHWIFFQDLKKMPFSSGHRRILVQLQSLEDLAKLAS
jgi:A/G-specific adenine glycosylase